jgi:hypothetical protein
MIKRVEGMSSRPAESTLRASCRHEFSAAFKRCRRARYDLKLQTAWRGCQCAFGAFRTSQRPKLATRMAGGGTCGGNL